MSRSVSLIAIALALLPMPAPAQSGDIERSTVPPGPAGRDDNFVGGFDFDYEISEDSSAASVTIGGYGVDTANAGNGHVQGNLTWSVKASAPVGGASDLTSDTTLDALRNGPELGFAVSKFWFRGAAEGMRSARFRQALDLAVERCKATVDEAVPGAVAAAVDEAIRQRSSTQHIAAVRLKVLNAAADALDRASPPVPVAPKAELSVRDRALALIGRHFDDAATNHTLDEAIDSFAGTTGQRVREELIAITVPVGSRSYPIVSAACNDLNLQGAPAANSQFVKRYSGWSETEVNLAYRDWMYRLGVEGGIGVNRFEYIDAGTLDKHDPSKVQFRAALFAGFYPPDGVSAILLRSEYQNAYEAAEEALVCRPTVSDPDEDCITGAPTPPANIERLNLSFEYRRVFELSGGPGDLAISPRGTYDALGDEWAAEFPVYFIPRKASAFSPGVNVTYASTTDKFAFGVFLRSKF